MTEIQQKPWLTAMYEDIKKCLDLPESAEITTIREREESSGGCETCWFEFEVVDIHYQDLSEDGPVYGVRTVDMSVGDFLQYVGEMEDG